MTRNSRIAWLARIGFIVCLFAMIFPAAFGANRVEPFILGLPFLFFWYVLWVFILFLGLVALYVVDGREVA